MDVVAMHRFAVALLDPGLPRERGFDVHRNTVVSSLATALAEGFPSVARLVGAGFFAAMAAVHVRRHPPRHPVLMAYGDDFASFLESFEPVAHLPYLADVARLDGLRRRAWHALEVPALDAAALTGASAEDSPPEALGDWRVRLHPSVGLLRSEFPARTIWAAQNGDALPERIDWQPETSVVWRVDGDVAVAALDAPALALLDDVRRGTTLGALLSDRGGAALHPARMSAFADALQRGWLVEDRALAKAGDRRACADLFAGFLPIFPTPLESHPGDRA